MKKLNISIDAGGTHTRLKVEINESGKITFTSQEYIQKINSKTELKDFIKSSLDKLDSDPQTSNCVIGFAGPVLDHRKVNITNWKSNPTITLEDLIEWGFQKDKTIMFNDMELAGYGILDMKENKEMKSELCETLYTPDLPPKNRINNKLVIAPGTGFGTASIIEFTTHSGKKVKDVLSSEIQHIQIPPLDERHAEIIELILFNKPVRSFLNYEDFVSGKGLCETYEAIIKLDKIEQKEQINASEIANLAVKGSDKSAIEALDIFYRCTGRIIQAMALMIQPYGGIYLCGASTINNKKFIYESRLMEEYHNCLIRQQLLVQFPVYIIIKPDINIAGGLWACRNVL